MYDITIRKELDQLKVANLQCNKQHTKQTSKNLLV